MKVIADALPAAGAAGPYANAFALPVSSARPPPAQAADAHINAANPVASERLSGTMDAVCIGDRRSGATLP